MKITKILTGLLCAMLAMTIQGCADTNTKKNAGAMRIWISPEYRQNVKVDQHGYTYVVVKR
jgi:hypothetical protein